MTGSFAEIYVSLKCEWHVNQSINYFEQCEQHNFALFTYTFNPYIIMQKLLNRT